MEYAEEKEFTSFEEETTSASDAEESRMLNSLDAGTDGLETSPPRSLLGLEQLRDRARMHVQEVSRPLFQLLHASALNIGGSCSLSRSQPLILVVYSDHTGWTQVGLHGSGDQGTQSGCDRDGRDAVCPSLQVQYCRGIRTTHLVLDDTETSLWCKWSLFASFHDWVWGLDGK